MKTPKPERIGPYEVREHLGSGGMGEVFLAWDSRLERQVAIKRIRGDLMASEDRLLRFRREARAAARLSHPAIVQIHDLLEEPSGDSIIMEYVEGSPLADMAAGSGLDVLTSVRLGEQIGRGLAHAHEAGLVHRDLKTENVMVTGNGEAKILDFGLAKNVRGKGETSSLTRSGVALGTVRAMSPEQAEGEAVDTRSDLYSLGVLLYELLAGLPPLRGANEFQVYRKILTERPVPLRALRPELPRELSDLVAGLLEKLPAHRPASARQVAAALGDIAGKAELSLLGPPKPKRSQELPSSAPTTPGPGISPIASPPPQHLSEGSTTASPAKPAQPRDIRKWTKPLQRPKTLRVVVSALILGALILGVVLWAIWASATRPQKLASAPLPQTPYELYQQGLRFLERYDREGYIEQAIQAFEQAVAIDSDYAPAYSGLGRAYWRQAAYKKDPVWLRQALENARISVELAPQMSHGQVTLALTQIAQGEYEPARESLEAILALDPSNVDAHRGLADLARSNGRPREAIQSYREALRVSPENWEVQGKLGVLLSKTGDYSGAQQAFEAALEIAPDHHFLWLSLGAIYHFQGKFAEAATAIQRSIEIRPTGAAYSNLGTLYFFQGKYREAATAFERAVELAANQYITWANLGDAYRRIPGRGADSNDALLRAIQLIEETLAEHPADRALRSRLALYQAKRNDCSSARESIEALAPRASSSANTSYRMALALELCGDRDAALLALEAALQAGYSFSEARQEPDLIQLREDVRFHRVALAFADSSMSREDRD